MKQNNKYSDKITSIFAKTIGGSILVGVPTVIGAASPNSGIWIGGSIIFFGLLFAPDSMDYATKPDRELISSDNVSIGTMIVGFSMMAGNFFLSDISHDSACGKNELCNPSAIEQVRTESQFSDSPIIQAEIDRLRKQINQTVTIFKPTP